MAYTFMTWNVQTFGNLGGDKNYRGVYGYTQICNFIAYVLDTAAVDMFALIELNESGVQYLGTLRTALEARTREAWTCDYVLGAVKQPPFGADHINGNPRNVRRNDLEWSQSANHEGYALFWRNRTVTLAKPATDSEKLSVNEYLGLVLEGRAWAGRDWEPEPYPQDLNAISNTLTFPTNTAFSFYSCRRPMFFYLNHSGKLVPIVVYHAPYNAQNRTSGGGQWSSAGTLTGALAKQLYERQTCVVAGDFNEDIRWMPTDQQHPYRLYWRSVANRGAALQIFRSALPMMNGRPDQVPGTMINYKKGLYGVQDDYINSQDVAAYAGSAFDNLFYRGVVPAYNQGESGVFDLIGYAQRLGRELGGIFPELFSPYVNSMNLDNTEWGSGQVSRNDSAAEFLRRVVSDHQPIFIRFDVPLP